MTDNRDIVSIAEISPNTWQVTVNGKAIIGYAQPELAIAAARALVLADLDAKRLDPMLPREKVHRAREDSEAEESTAQFQVTFEIGGLFASAESAKEYAQRLMQTDAFAAFVNVPDADVFCFIRDVNKGDAVARNCNGGDWDNPFPYK